MGGSCWPSGGSRSVQYDSAGEYKSATGHFRSNLVILPESSNIKSRVGYRVTSARKVRTQLLRFPRIDVADFRWMLGMTQVGIISSPTLVV